MKHIKSYKLFESLNSPEDILKNISLDLSDEGLYIYFPNDNKFGGKFYLSVEDKDKIFCKNYPKDDMDWLYGKPIINDFIDKLKDFDLIRDVHYKIYAGGLGVNFVFDDKNVVEI
jgi:hypothetical protein